MFGDYFTVLFSEVRSLGGQKVLCTSLIMHEVFHRAVPSVHSLSQCHSVSVFLHLQSSKVGREFLIGRQDAKYKD